MPTEQEVNDGTARARAKLLAKLDAVATTRGRTAADVATEVIARTCHEANRVLQRIAGEEPSPAWGDAPDWQRESALVGVRAALSGAVTDAEAQHEAWAQHKLADGWVYGPEKDADAKTHPCLVPYADLPPIQRAKDEMFRAIVGALSPR